ncbi:DNA repair protein [Slackia faecicanis]|uniref:DNA repair protein n=1 Tax=Slackia faecicanis TaxID=255723 RepID=A0A3N0AFV5_9ACTN|nr:DNA repair protein [Slackia faecicanis]RNL20611.1 DNA repair protein [Slackia faecicanis]
MKSERTYLCIDLKTFYASVECADRGLDPFTTNLVVADESRGRTTICLAITPALKKLGVRNRCRLFEIPEGIPYTAVVPRMKRYMEASSDIYAIYLQFVSPEDIHIYSIDECFIDATPYLALYGKTAHEFADMLMGEVLQRTGIRATAGIGANLFLAKVALDITAKHERGGIGMLDERSFKQDIWFHRPITDIWGIGPGIARRLERHGIRDLASVAAADPDVLYREFGKNAEYLIDHAWGQEPCTIAEIQAYRPEGRSIVNGQVLPGTYSFSEARMVLAEMIDASVLDLVEQGLSCNHIALSVGYAREASAENRSGNTSAALSQGAGRAYEAQPEATNFFDGGHGKRAVGRSVYHDRTGASRTLGRRTNSRRYLMDRFLELYDETTRRDTPIKRLSICFAGLDTEEFATYTLFDSPEADEAERNLQQAVVNVRAKFGKNAVLKATSLYEKATARERNNQIGGHRA